MVKRLPGAATKRVVENGRLPADVALDVEALREVVAAVNEEREEPPEREPEPKAKKGGRKRKAGD